ncbi:MAG: hypothetical protein IJJ85_11655 [Clostridia bacterium]|nr:hypothetical protein [Clostridia bacterium]
MVSIAELLRQMPPLYALLSCLDNLLVVTGCACLSVSLFHLPIKKKPISFILPVLLCIVCGVVPPGLFKTDFTAFVWSTVLLLLPFVCMALLFWGREAWKAFLSAAGYAFVEALRFLVLLVFCGFDNESRDDALELAVGFVVDLAVFLLAYLLLARYAKRRRLNVNVTGTGAILFGLMTVSSSVFIATLMLLGAHAETKQAEFALMLTNVPFITATVTFALVRFFKVRNESENYKRQLEMQINQFAWMERMAEDVRVFRHDFPKKMRPLIASLEDGRPAEAKRIAQEFSDFAANTGERFHTGNFRLDTVLFCERQVAERAGVKLDVSFNSVFPENGIDPDDIYTIFPNALDNAIEAAAKAGG